MHDHEGMHHPHALKPPEGMTPALWKELAKLTPDVRERVLERAAIIQESTGCSWEEADQRALTLEVPGQRALPGVGP